MSPFVIILILAVLQGITEMLPVSSSGHLALGRHFFDLEADAGWVEVFLHTGTLASIILYYRKRIWTLIHGFFTGQKDIQRQCYIVVAASIPVCISGFVANKFLDEILNNLVLIAVCLMTTGALLLSLFKKLPEERELSPARALSIGLMQAIAILPGISRSGITIVTARHCGIAPKQAAEFSFLISLIPLFGASAVKTLEAAETGMGGLNPMHITIGALIAAITGYVALAILNRMLSSNTFRYFGFYCALAGILLLIA